MTADERMALSIAVGLCLGAVAGSVIGLMTDKLALGLGFGPAAGLIIGLFGAAFTSGDGSKDQIKED